MCLYYRSIRIQESLSLRCLRVKIYEFSLSYCSLLRSLCFLFSFLLSFPFILMILLFLFSIFNNFLYIPLGNISEYLILKSRISLNWRVCFLKIISKYSNLVYNRILYFTFWICSYIWTLLKWTVITFIFRRTPNIVTIVSRVSW